MTTKIVGIVNVTTDSFSDGGLFFKPESAIERAHKLFSDGASIIDIGAESTRPGATVISPEEEWERLKHILPEIIKDNIPVSVDTRNYQTAQKALDMGAKWINDVSGISDEKMLKTVQHTTIVIMHNLGIPADKNYTLPANEDHVSTIIDWGKKKIQYLMHNNIKVENLIFDPGIGFGKTAEQSLAIVERAEEFKTLGVPLLFGHSRKSFLSLFNKSRDDATIEISKILIKKGIDYLRLHDVSLSGI